MVRIAPTVFWEMADAVMGGLVVAMVLTLILLALNVAWFGYSMDFGIRSTS